MKKILIFLGFLIFFFRPAAVLAGQGSTVYIDISGFKPSVTEIKKGDTVTFENQDSLDHWPASNIHPTHLIYPEFDPKKAVNPGKSWSFKFDKAGTWRYHDHLFPDRTGVVKVQESGDANTSLITQIKEFLSSLLKKIIPKSKNQAFRGPENPNISANDETLFTNDGSLYSYIKKYGPKKTIQQLNSLSAKYGDCHQTAHKAGRISYDLYGSKSFQLCSSECHSGCYHGATEAYFRDHGTKNLTKDLNILCSSELNPFFSHQCLHGIGHGLMAWSDYDLNLALKSCEMLSAHQDSCWTGVFMENIIGGLATEASPTEQKTLAGHFTKYLNNDPQYPCNIVEEKYKPSCYFLQTSRTMQLFNGDFSKIAKACSDAPTAYQSSCFQSMGRDVGGVFRNNSTGAIGACQSVPGGSLRIDCLVGAVQDSFWDPSGQDQAIGFCKLLISSKEKSACYNTIFERAPQVLASKSDLSLFCSKAEYQYRDLCQNNLR